MKYAANRDRGEKAIIQALRKAGALVLPLNLSRAGVPDLLVSYRQTLFLLEVKSPIGRRGGSAHVSQMLRDKQAEFHQLWKPHCQVVRSPLEALCSINAISPEELSP